MKNKIINNQAVKATSENTLSKEECDRFEKLHYDVDSAIIALAGSVLRMREIKEDKLYREDYESCDTYCDHAFGMSHDDILKVEEDSPEAAEFLDVQRAFGVSEVIKNVTKD